jgi:uncharacterized protein YxjI
MAELPPAGWYTQPDGTRRFWDGVQWAEHEVSAGFSNGAPGAPTVGLPTIREHAAWHPDPSGRHELRWWDGCQWTEHVVSLGQQQVDPLTPAVRVAKVATPSWRVRRQVRKAGAKPARAATGGTLLTEPILIVNQKAKTVGVNAEYAIFGQNGQQVGVARELGQTQIKKSLSLIPDENRLHTLQILDMDGRMLLALTRPAKLIKSKMRVAAADGTPIGQVVQKTTGFIHDVRFTLEADGKVLGTLETDSAESIRFSIRDAAGTEIGRISKTWAGLRKEWFTNADNYVVQIHRPLDEPLRSLVVAAAIAVDMALRQGDSAHEKARRDRHDAFWIQGDPL